MKTIRARHVLETCLYVDDLAAAERFYAGVLGLDVVSRDAGRDVFFRCGDGVVLLFNANATAKGGDRPAHGATGPGHVAFVSEENEIDAWLAHLASHGVAIERDMTLPNGGRSLYFRDPAGNSLELATRKVWRL